MIFVSAMIFYTMSEIRRQLFLKNGEANFIFMSHREPQHCGAGSTKMIR